MRKPLVVWLSDLDLDRTPNRALAIAVMFQGISRAANRDYVLMVEGEPRPIPNTVLQTFDQVFVLDGQQAQCVKNRYGDPDEAKCPTLWRYRGRLNRIRLRCMMAWYAEQRKTGNMSRVSN